ncbi:MAG: hypothetical protein J0M12_00835 [Deltaproteobacteria bacterium]|nr:hypothetical protein [Deltaproteobacteria bacterium]
MGFQDFISEHEAIHITGMSRTTLSRFAEAGYLQLETDSDGLRMFSKGELAGLFGLKETPQRERTETIAPKSSVKKEATPIEVAAPKPPAEPRLAEQVERVVNVAPAPIVEQAKPEAPPQEQAAASQAPFLELEIQRLKNLMQLQERILDMKDQQLQDLKEQRDWLQARVEKLEDKADRDQILLLTETQTIRTLINVQQQHKRRSPVRLALEWLGVTAPEEENKNANASIDVSTGMMRPRED